MLTGSVLTILGFVIQAAGWLFYRRDFPKFWVSKPIWYFLYPNGTILFVAGVLTCLGGLVINQISG